eukprot:gene5730-7127_t
MIRFTNRFFNSISNSSTTNLTIQRQQQQQLQQINYYSFISKKKQTPRKNTANSRLNKSLEPKPSYIKLSEEELLEKRKNAIKNKSFIELLQDSIGKVQPASLIARTQQKEEKMTIEKARQMIIESKENAKKLKKKSSSASQIPLSERRLFTDEKSSETDLALEESLKLLMIQQGKDDVSDVRIPSELIEKTVNEATYEIDPEEGRFADLFFSKSTNLESMAIKSIDFPKKPYPQVAFLGRSNVGKSSLVNALLNREVAYVSKTPGCTKSVNFYQLWEKLLLVDLPGYGYASVSKKRSTVWGHAISEFLLTSSTLVKVFLLIDGRIGIQKNDREVMRLLDEHKVSFQIVLTKIDKSSTNTLKRTYGILKEEISALNCCMPQIIQSSSIEKQGIQQIRVNILTSSGLDKKNFISKKSAPPSPSKPKIKQ